MSTINDLERAEMMLSLGINEGGDPLSAQERDDLTEFLNNNRQNNEVTVESAASIEPTVGGGGGGMDIQAMIAAEVARQTGGGGQSGAQPVSLADVLSRIDPRDSEAALAMYEWLCENGRLGIVGTLNGGGYMLHYSEPKGTTKAGYTPGATQGGRMVDQAVAKAKESGAKPRQTGMCDQCWSAVVLLDDGTVVTDDDTKSAVCSTGGAHTFNA